MVGILRKFQEPSEAGDGRVAGSMVAGVTGARLRCFESLCEKLYFFFFFKII